ncbi:MAG: AAA family ATPase [Longimicrobiales bacterium]
MKLHRIRLTNFRQHAATEILLQDGITGIIGPNGAGKSTILEALGWAIYGSAAARGTNETIRFSRAASRSRVEVELEFGLGGHEYRIVRTLGGADVFLDGGTAPVATGIAPSTVYLEGRLGMSRDEFFNTYFTGQKELQFLAQMGPTQRSRFLSQVLGYERLRRAQERTRARRNHLRARVDGLRGALPDAAAVRLALEAAEARDAEAIATVERARLERSQAAARRDTLRPEWDAAQKSREQARELEHAIAQADRERETAERDVRRAADELAAIAAAELRLVALTNELLALPGLVEECARQAERARLDERRRALDERTNELTIELRELSGRIGKLERAPTLRQQYHKQLDEQRVGLASAEREVEACHREWVAKRENVATRLRNYLDRAQELEEQVERLRAAGPDGICPTCRKPLGVNYGAVLGKLEDEYQEVIQDGKWLRQREKQLADKPPELAAAEALRATTLRAIEAKSDRLARCERAANELGVLIQERERKQESLEMLRAEIEALPAGYDAAAHRAAESRLAALRGLEREAAKLEQVVEARALREREHDAGATASAAAAQLAAELEAKHAALRITDTHYDSLRERFDAAADAARRAELREAESAAQAEVAEAALRRARADAAEDRARRNSLMEVETELRHHDELDQAFSQLRQELNARVRPDLSELASRFLTDITDGRYTALEINDDYDVLVLDDGEEKPVISGGEEDVTNLVLRLAISQMIAERAGQPLSILVLDEVFGSLDFERRDSVVQLLRRLRDRFEQIILITHIEAIRDGMDHVVRVMYDERSGSSRVMEELPDRGAPALLAGV